MITGIKNSFSAIRKKERIHGKTLSYKECMVQSRIKNKTILRRKP